MSRNAIFSALFTKLSACASFATTSQRLRHWSEISPAQQPALFVPRGTETIHQVTGQPAITTLEAHVWIYATTTDPNVAPQTQINDLLDAITAAIAPVGALTTQTLGGLVQHCWIDGPIETDEGSLGDQAVAKLTIKMLTTT